MIHITGIADLKLRRNPLQTGALPTSTPHNQNRFPSRYKVCHPDPGMYPYANMIRFLFIIGNIFNYKIINLRYHIQIRIAVLFQRLSPFFTHLESAVKFT